MPYVPNHCCCDRTGLCTTRWYPLQGVSYYGNPTDAYVGDHGSATFRVAVTEDGSAWKTWVASGESISKFDLPDSADPIKIWTKYFFYDPPVGASGTPDGPRRLRITEMRGVNDGSDNAVVIGTQAETALKDEVFIHSDLVYPGDILTSDRSSYWGYNGLGISEALTAADVASKFDIGYREYPDTSLIDPHPATPSTGGFFRMTLTQWVGSGPCGAASFTNNDDAGTVEWLNPPGAEEDSGDMATASGENEESQWLVGLFGFQACLIDFASMVSVDVSIKRYASDNSSTVWVKDKTLRIFLENNFANLSSSDKAETSLKWPTSLEIQNYGGDLWGFAPTDDYGIIGVALRVEFGNNGPDAFVDQVSVTVSYLDTNGDPQTATINDILAYAIRGEGLGSGEQFFPSQVAWKGHNLGESGRHVGFYTNAITEVFPLDATGADVAAVLSAYLDPRYSVSGSGQISASTDLTLTFTHDGTMDDEIIIWQLGGSGVYSDQGHWLIGVQIMAFPNEAASLHMIDNTGEIQWSRCGNQEFSTYQVGYGSRFLNRRVTKINVDRDGEKIFAIGGGFFPMNWWDFDGEAQDLGAYVGLGSRMQHSDVYDAWLYETEERTWRALDLEGYAYSQGSDLVLVRYGPSGPEATLEAEWSVLLPFAIQVWTVTDDALVCAGFNPDTETNQVGIIVTDGTIGWVSEIPRGPGYVGSTDYQGHRIWQELNDVWVNPSKAWVVLAANAGCYRYHYSTGVLDSYFPHGRSCRSAVMIEQDGDDYLVLTGSTAFIAIDPADMDIDPETLT